MAGHFSKNPSGCRLAPPSGSAPLNPAVCLLEADMEGRIIQATPGCQRLLGFQPEELAGKNVLELSATANGRRALARHMAGVVGQGGPAQPFFAQLARADGGLAEVEIIWDLRPGSERAPAGFLAALRQVPPYGTTEQCGHGPLVAGITMDILVVDAQRRVCDASMSFLVNRGLTREDVIGRPCHQVLSGKSQPCHEQGQPCRLCQVLTDGHSARFLHRREDHNGQPEWLEIEQTPLRDRDGNISHVVESLRDVSPLVAAQKALAESENRFRAFYESGPLAFLSLDGQGKICQANQAFLKLTGYSEMQLLDLPFEELLASPQSTGWSDGITGLASGGELELITVDQGRLLVSLEGFLALEEDGGLHLILQDLSERKKTERELRLSRQKFSKAFEQSPVWVVISRLEDGRYLEVNQAFLKGTGFRKSEVLGKSSLEVGTWVDPADRARVVENVRRHGSVRNLEVKRRVKGGLEITTLFNSERIDMEGKPCLLSVSLDITERKRVEEALRKNEATLRTLFALIPDMVCSFTEEGFYTFIHIPPGFPSHISMDDVGKNIYELLPAHLVEERRRLVREVLATGRMVTHEFSLEIEGTLCHRQARYLPYADDEVLAVIADVTQRRELEMQLQQAQKMEAIGTLTGGIAHDFNNILQAASGYVQIMLSQTDHEHCPAFLAEVDRILSRGVDLVSSLLTFSRKSSPNFQVVDVNELVLQTARVLQRTIPKMVEIELRLADDAWLVRCDESQLEQVLLNLGSNARDAMPAGGRLVISTANQKLGREDLPMPDMSPGEWLRLSVSDNGQGMDEKTCAHIFEPFFTTKKVGQGTGLGLSTVYGVVKGHGGQIRCNSRPGEGTAFDIYLPALPEAERRVAAEKSQPTPESGRGQTVLLVDDEPQILATCSMYLAKLGYQILTAESGEAALQVYRENPGQVDMVVLDLGMPGMGGERCLEELLALDSRAKVIIASGYAQQPQANRLLAGGAKGYLKKPYRMADLAGLLAAAGEPPVA